MNFVERGRTALRAEYEYSEFGPPDLKPHELAYIGLCWSGEPFKFDSSLYEFVEKHFDIERENGIDAF